MRLGQRIRPRAAPDAGVAMSVERVLKIIHDGMQEAGPKYSEAEMKRVSVIDSHTGGEPTRVVIAGGPELGGGSVADRLNVFREQHDRFRSAVVNEPRGSDVMVGALLVEPEDKSCVAGVIFFNNVGYLGMCGHGTIGLVVTLAHLGRIKPGEHKIETPVGVVTATLHANGEVSVANVPSWRKAKAVIGGRSRHRQNHRRRRLGRQLVFSRRANMATNSRWPTSTRSPISAWRIRQAVNAQGFPEVDHVELFGPPTVPAAHSRNFVLCPGKAYDRSPCGTGTSAKLACLAADGKLAEGATWIQESILGSKFTGKFRWLNRERGEILPVITGTALVNAEVHVAARRSMIRFAGASAS